VTIGLQQRRLCGGNFFEPPSTRAIDSPKGRNSSMLTVLSSGCGFDRGMTTHTYGETQVSRFGAA
jgi:hypothetical protein